MENCIFCKIINREIPTEFLYEDNLIVAFRDMHPIAPVHILMIPKRHIGSIKDIQRSDEQLMGRLITIAKKIADDLKISKKGYKLLYSGRKARRSRG